MTFGPISSEHASLWNARMEAYTLSGALVSCRLVRLPDIPSIGERVIPEGDTYDDISMVQPLRAGGVGLGLAVHPAGASVAVGRRETGLRRALGHAAYA